MFLFESIATQLDKRIRKMVEAAMTDRLREILPDELEPHIERVFEVIEAEKSQVYAKVEAQNAQIEEQAEEIRNLKSQVEAGLSRDAIAEALGAIEDGVRAIYEEAPAEVPPSEPEPVAEDPINGAVAEDGSVNF